MATAQATQKLTDQETVDGAVLRYEGFVYQIYETQPQGLFLIFNMATKKIREVEYNLQDAITTLRDLDRKAGWKENDDD